MATKLISGPSKADEYAELDRIISEQPADSYLRSILGGLRETIRAAIRNDYGFIEFDTWKAAREARELADTIIAHKKQLAALADEIKRRHDLLSAIGREFAASGDKAATTARIMADSAATIDKALYGPAATFARMYQQAAR